MSLWSIYKKDYKKLHKHGNLYKNFYFYEEIEIIEYSINK